MAAIYFMGIKPEPPDRPRPCVKRCTCAAQPNITVEAVNGDPFAHCPVCAKEFVVLVETDWEGVHLTPAPPWQII